MTHFLTIAHSDVIADVWIEGGRGMTLYSTDWWDIQSGSPCNSQGWEVIVYLNHTVEDRGVDLIVPLTLRMRII